MPAESTNPLLWPDGVLLVFCAEELADGDESVVAKLEAILGNLPSVDVVEVWRDDWESVVDEAGVDEVDVKPCAKVGQPDVAIEQTLAYVNQQSPFSFDEIPVCFCVVEDVENFRLSATDFLKTYTEHNAKIRVQTRCFNIPT